jgi:hypothetical protein
MKFNTRRRHTRFSLTASFRFPRVRNTSWAWVAAKGVGGGEEWELVLGEGGF